MFTFGHILPDISFDLRSEGLDTLLEQLDIVSPFFDLAATQKFTLRCMATSSGHQFVFTRSAE